MEKGFNFSKFSNWSITFLLSKAVKIIFFNLFCLQDCHIKTHSASGEPVPDTSQDYVLLSSSENATHTILRFRRKLNTCDEKFDVPITVSTSKGIEGLIR
jgi:hypothetical protein